MKDRNLLNTVDVMDVASITSVASVRQYVSTLRQSTTPTQPEGELGAEYGLALQTGALARVQVVEILFQVRGVHVEYFFAEVQGAGAIGPMYHAGVRLAHGVP